MAPVPTTANLLDMPVQATPPWVHWVLLSICGLVGLLLAVFIIGWIAPKAKKCITASIERAQHHKLVLPTHLDPQAPRPVVLPLPCTLTVVEEVPAAEQKEPSIEEEADKSQEAIQDESEISRNTVEPEDEDDDDDDDDDRSEAHLDGIATETAAEADERMTRLFSDLEGSCSTIWSTSSASISSSMNLYGDFGRGDDSALASFAFRQLSAHVTIIQPQMDVDLSTHLEEEEFASFDESDSVNTPTLSPTVDSDSDSDDFSMRTPPIHNGSSLVSSHSIGLTDEALGEFYGSLPTSAAFSGSLCYACSDVDSASNYGSSTDSVVFIDPQCDDDMAYDMEIPIIALPDEFDVDDDYYYDGPSLVSTASTAALYELGMSSYATRDPPLVPCAPIPINFAPTLPSNCYLFVPPPGSNEYFYNPAPSPTILDEDSEPFDLSRLGLTPTSEFIDLTSDEFILGSSPRRRGRIRAGPDNGHEHAFVEDISPSLTGSGSEESPSDSLRLGLRPTSDFSNLATDDFVLGSAPIPQVRTRAGLHNGHKHALLVNHTLPPSTGSEGSPSDLSRLGLQPTSDFSTTTTDDFVLGFHDQLDNVLPVDKAFPPSTESQELLPHSSRLGLRPTSDDRDTAPDDFVLEYVSGPRF